MTSMASIQPLPLSDRRPLTGVDLPRPALVGEAVRDPKRSLAELRYLARTKSSQFTFGRDIIVPFTFPTMACFLNISMARRVAESSIADCGI
jgi:hypothetical protein